MSEEHSPDVIVSKDKKAKPPKPPKKVKRGSVIHEPEKSVYKINIFRDRLIAFSGNVSLALSLALLVSAASNAWIITQPNLPSPFYIQYISGQITGIKVYSKEGLPPPLPLDIIPLPPQARLDDAPIYSSGYVETDPRMGVKPAEAKVQPDPSPATPAQASP